MQPEESHSRPRPSRRTGPDDHRRTPRSARSRTPHREDPSPASQPSLSPPATRLVVDRDLITLQPRVVDPTSTKLVIEHGPKRVRKLDTTTWAEEKPLPRQMLSPFRLLRVADGKDVEAPLSNPTFVDEWDVVVGEQRHQRVAACPAFDRISGKACFTGVGRQHAARYRTSPSVHSIGCRPVLRSHSVSYSPRAA